MQQQTQQFDKFPENPKKPATLNIHRLFLVISLMLLTAFILILSLYYVADNRAWQSKGKQYLCTDSTAGQITLCYKS